jgi:hypothetical protein
MLDFDASSPRKQASKEPRKEDFRDLRYRTKESRYFVGDRVLINRKKVDEFGKVSMFRIGIVLIERCHPAGLEFPSYVVRLCVKDKTRPAVYVQHSTEPLLLVDHEHIAGLVLNTRRDCDGTVVFKDMEGLPHAWIL